MASVVVEGRKIKVARPSLRFPSFAVITPGIPDHARRLLTWSTGAFGDSLGCYFGRVSGSREQQGVAMREMRVFAVDCRPRTGGWQTVCVCVCSAMPVRTTEYTDITARAE
jgi:hypothetical protein